MTWNYRVVRTHDGQHLIAEVYYDDEGRPSGWCEANGPMGYSVDELFRDAAAQVRGLYSAMLVADEGGRLSEYEQAPDGKE